MIVVYTKCLAKEAHAHKKVENVVHEHKSDDHSVIDLNCTDLNCAEEAQHDKARM